jgi:hypothetical protein
MGTNYIDNQYKNQKQMNVAIDEIREVCIKEILNFKLRSL